MLEWGPETAGYENEPEITLGQVGLTSPCHGRESHGGS